MIVWINFSFIPTKSSFYIHQRRLWLHHRPYTLTTDKNCRRQFPVLRIPSPSIVCVSQQVSSIFQVAINWLRIRQTIVSCHLNLFGLTHEKEKSTKNEDGKIEWFVEADLSDPVSWALLCGAAQWGSKLWEWCKWQRKVEKSVGLIIGFVLSMIRKSLAGFQCQLRTWRHRCILITLSRDIQDIMSAWKRGQQLQPSETRSW